MGLHSIPYKVAYRDVKYPRLEFKTGNLLVVLPFASQPDTLLNKHRNWLLKKVKFIRECLKDAPNKKMIERTEENFRNLIYSFAKRASKESSAELDKTYFRTMKTKWASCSSKRNLTINTLMKHLPAYLIEYIIFHEIAHLKEKKHNDEFWKRISKKFKNYQDLERDLFVYWFQIGKSLPFLNSFVKDKT
jgi:predicted metal-dependent hydrolase